jgi:hypothetical protein
MKGNAVRTAGVCKKSDCGSMMVLAGAAASRIFGVDIGDSDVV